MIFRRKNKIPNKKEDKYHLAVDIGTEYVKSVVYTVSSDEIDVIGYSRTKQKEASMYAAFIINLQDVIDTVDKSMGEAVEMAIENVGEGFVLPKKVIIGVAGELVQGVTIMVNVERDYPEREITQKELDEFVNKVKKHTFANTKEEIAREMGLKAAHVEEVSTQINSVYIDGIKVNNPLGYKGGELIYRVFSTFAPKLHIESIQQVANKLNLELSQLVVEPYALSLGITGMREVDANAIIIDIGGGTTDVAIIQEGDILGTKMFAVGGRVFTKRVERELGLNYEEAEEMKIQYSKGKAPKDAEAKLKKAFGKDISTWLTGVEIALEEFNEVREYPSNIYLCGGGALLPEIQEGLMTHPWLQTLNFKKFPKVNFIFPNSVKDVLDKTKKATQPMDVTPLALARMSLN